MACSIHVAINEMYIIDFIAKKHTTSSWFEAKSRATLWDAHNHTTQPQKLKYFDKVIE
jgi:hypothetical protein